MPLASSSTISLPDESITENGKGREGVAASLLILSASILSLSLKLLGAHIDCWWKPWWAATQLNSTKKKKKKKKKRKQEKKRKRKAKSKKQNGSKKILENTT